tara:strand:+ start:107 stop:1693 length:1587 start_codon:yes stop_codon:yes gene_type:complete
MDEFQNYFGIGAATLFLAVGYFFPTLISFLARRPKLWRIALVNLFFGWTGVVYLFQLFRAWRWGRGALDNRDVAWPVHTADGFNATTDESQTNTQSAPKTKRYEDLNTRTFDVGESILEGESSFGVQTEAGWDGVALKELVEDRFVFVAPAWEVWISDAKNDSTGILDTAQEAVRQIRDTRVFESVVLHQPAVFGLMIMPVDEATGFHAYMLGDSNFDDKTFILFAVDSREARSYLQVNLERYLSERSNENVCVCLFFGDDVKREVENHHLWQLGTEGIPDSVDVLDMLIIDANRRIVEVTSFQRTLIKGVFSGDLGKNYVIDIGDWESGKLVPVLAETRKIWDAAVSSNGAPGNVTSADDNSDEGKFGDDDDKMYDVDEGETEMKALLATIEASIEADFGQTDISDGSLYLAVIRTEEAILVADDLSKEIKFELGEQTLVLGSFWEESIEYQYDKSDGEWSIRVSGPFAFELLDDTGLDGLDVDDGPIEELIVVFRIDGDSPAVVPSIRSSGGVLSETEEDDDFEGL